MVAAEHERLGHDLQEIVRENSGIRRIADVRHQQGEFVAAKSGQRVGRSHIRLQPFGDRLEQPVSDRMSQRIVDILEMIEIEIKHREAALAAARAFDRPGDLGDEDAAIGQSGEDVDLRHPLELVFRFLALRNFAGCRKQEIASAEGGAADRDLDPEQPAVLGLAAPIERLRHAGSRLLHFGKQVLARVRRLVLGEVADLHLKQFFARVAEQLAGARLTSMKAPVSKSCRR